MIRVVINSCYGCFYLSDEAYEWLIKERGWRVTSMDAHFRAIDPAAEIVEFPEEHRYAGRYKLGCFDKDDPKFRAHPDLIAVVEALGDRAGGTQLEIIEIPDDVEHWQIHNYDGREWVSEGHRTWM